MGTMSTFHPPLTTLLDITSAHGSRLSPELERLYSGPLGDLPTIEEGVSANLISTLDGIVALSDTEPTGGGELRKDGWHDTAVAGMLRASCDALMIGGTTFRSFPKGKWTASSFCPELHDELADIAKPSLLVVITKSGHLPPIECEELVPRILAVTTPEGASRLTSVPTWSEEMCVVMPSPFSFRNLLSHLATTRGIRNVLAEGGPTLVGALLREDLIRDMFLTLSPMIIGRDISTSPRALVHGISYSPVNAPYGTYTSIRTDGNLLFLRVHY